MSRNRTGVKRMLEHDKELKMVYAHVAGVWVAGNIRNQIGTAMTINLVTGATVIRQQSEIRLTSPRLDDPQEWPI